MKTLLPLSLCLLGVGPAARLTAAAPEATPARAAPSIPTVDLSADPARQVVVARGTETVYQGHPTTVLLPDGQTMFCVWTLGHGGTCGPMKRSDDGGKTWGDLLPTPENWKGVRNCPAIYRLTDPKGVARLFVFAGRGPDGRMQQAHSADGGKTWTPMASTGLTCVMPFCTIVPVEGGKGLLGQTNIRRPGETRDRTSNVIAQSTSEDGGLTWSPWRIVLDLGDLKPCEPALVRSPDSKQLLCLLRENTRKAGGLYMTSDDEGRSWSDARQLPAGLHGDRHMARYAPEGRLVVCFRDTGKASPTRNHFVAWVGRYEDIVNGRDGQYRVKLLHSHAGGDCGYSGLELLPDQTFVATTYIKYRPGPEKQSVVSTRFRLGETDKLAEKATGVPAPERQPKDAPPSGVDADDPALRPVPVNTAPGATYADGTRIFQGMSRQARQRVVVNQATGVRRKPARVIEADVCVYGGTSGGVVAAVQAARMGKTAVIAEPGRHLGGMTAGGLSAVDIGDPRTVGGIAREYFTRLVGKYGNKLAWDRPFPGKGGGPATGGAFAIEPHTAEQLFNEMVREAKVPVHFHARLASVKKDGTRITELVTEDGTVFRAKVFLDTTYEGDLMARAGVSYTLTREGNAKYGETYNGIHYAANFRPRTDHRKPGPNGRTPGGQGVWDRDLPLDPYVVPGDPQSGLLPLVQAGDPGVADEPAPGVQAYCFRLCLTTASDRITITPPPGYDPKRYELVARFIAGCVARGDDMDLRWFAKHDPLPHDKWDFNTATFGGNLPGASWAWPEASYARRGEIAKEHEDYHRGLLHFLATDPRVPPKVREEMKRFGLPRDEFTDNGGWPHQLYVREGRRMVSDLVMTEQHTFGRRQAPGSVGLGSYGTDTHEVRRVVKDGVVTREGKTATGRGGAPPYPIGYGALVPKAGECENLLVPFALSASHTAFSSIRMEPVFMVTSQSAATAACLAVEDHLPVQKVDYTRLRTRLLADRQILDWTEPAKPASR